MNHEGYSVEIPEGDERSEGYIGLPHNTEYSLKLRNHNSTRCDAHVTIDGEHVGTWRVNANASIRIERPADVQRKFTFYKLGTPEAKKANLKSNEDLGLIAVKFTPEVEVVRGSRGWNGELPGIYGATFNSGEPSLRSYGGAKGMSAGGTGLGASSGQTFGSALPIVYDRDKEVTIHLRLACVEKEDIIPLRKRSTPVPPPLA